MNDLEPTEEESPSTSALSQQGLTAVAYTAGGIFMLLMQAITRNPVMGLIVGGIACVVGIGLFVSKDAADKKAGMVIGAAGILALLSRVGLTAVKAIAGTLIGIAGIGLLVLGFWNAIKFFKGLKKRS